MSFKWLFCVRLFELIDDGGGAVSCGPQHLCGHRFLEFTFPSCFHCGLLAPGLWAHSRLHVSSHNTDQLYQLRASSQVFLPDLLIKPSHIVYPLAHQKSQNSVKSYISVKKKWNSDVGYSDNGDRIWIFEIHRWCIVSFKQRTLFIVDVDACMPSATWRVLFVLDTEVCCPLAWRALSTSGLYLGSLWLFTAWQFCYSVWNVTPVTLEF